MKTLLLNLLGSVGLVIAGGTILLIMAKVQKDGYIRIVEPNRTIRIVELGAGGLLILLGIASTVWACKKYKGG